jgi:hypothetical protein
VEKELTSPGYPEKSMHSNVAAVTLETGLFFAMEAKTSPRAAKELIILDTRATIQGVSYLETFFFHRR